MRNRFFFSLECTSFSEWEQNPDVDVFHGFLCFFSEYQTIFLTSLIHLQAFDALEHHIEILVDPGTFLYKNLDRLLLFHRYIC